MQLNSLDNKISLNTNNNRILNDNKDDEVTVKVKRNATCITNQDEAPFITNKKRRVEIPDNEMVVEILRDEAFFMGFQEKRIHDLKKCKELGIDIFANSEISKKSSNSLRKVDLKAIEGIENKKGSEIGRQFFELYQSLKATKSINHPDCQCILDFANQIISQIPDKNCEVENNDEPLQDLYLEMAKAILNQLPFTFTEEQTIEHAKRLQKSIEQEAVNEEIQNESDSADFELIDAAIGKLGILLLIVQKDFKTAVECIEGNPFETASKLLNDQLFKIINFSKKLCMEHKKDHLNSALQDSDEALFQEMSIQMADLLLLDSGKINFGLLDILAKYLIPDEFQNLLAIDTLKTVMASLIDENLSNEIAAIDVPDSELNPSSFAIRAFFNLSQEQQITKRHAQMYVLSALLGHYRQAKVGSCFATAFLIKALQFHPELVIQDLRQLTEEGRISRLSYGEMRQFPCFNRVSKEFLDTEITVESDGYLTSTKLDNKKIQREKKPSTLTNTYIYETPGIISACNAMNIVNPKKAILEVIKTLPKKFTINDLLKNLATHAWNAQDAKRYHFRFDNRLTKEQILENGQFGFGIQTHHPLHRAYEQSAASMVSYFNTQYAFPLWIHGTLTEVIAKADKDLPAKLQNTFKNLQAEIFLPMITRMRFRYNPHIDEPFQLFEKTEHVAEMEHFYGYELCDAGLPEDFNYSTNLYENYKKEASSFKLETFHDYKNETLWGVINTEEKFKAFIQDVVKETIFYLKANQTKEITTNWNLAADLMNKAIVQSSFGPKMVQYLLGKQSSQKKEWNKNPHNLQTAPWSFKWGGDANAVMKTFFGFEKSPSKVKKFNGTAKEVLAKQINFIKNQPDELKNRLCDTPNLLMIQSPVHAFLMIPDDPTLVEAVRSDLSTNDYIKLNVEIPGVQIANSRLNIRERKELIDFIAENKWIGTYCEKEDFIRQKLTEVSKLVFDELIVNAPHLKTLSHENFEKELVSIVAKARSADPKIHARNYVWEKEFAKALHHLSKTLVVDMEVHEVVSENAFNAMIHFARNREDSVLLSSISKKEFLKKMESVPLGLSIKDFRQKVIDIAHDAHMLDNHVKDNKWKTELAEKVDTRIFEMLTDEQKQTLMTSAVIPHDPNWKEGVYDMRLCFMVNPGSGKLELVRMVPDLQQISFFDQDPWFPTGKDHGYWNFPDNYRTYKTAPLFNVKKYMR